MDTMKRAADMVVSGDGDFRVHVDAYTDPDVFDLEMDLVYSQWWVYVGHTSEIAENGDYKTTFMGRQPVIVSRGRDGEVRVLLNVCRHRGNAVCREEYGNSMAFRCPYHGWTYANDGRLIGVSGKVRYPEGFIDDIAGLMPAAAVGVYRGLIFATLSKDAPTFDEYIAPVAKYIDLWADLSIDGEVKMTKPWKNKYHGNWKMQMENALDGYHARATHESGIKAIRVDLDDIVASTQRLHYTDTGKDLSGGAHDGGGLTREFGGGHGAVDRADRTAFEYNLRLKDGEEYFEGPMIDKYGREHAEAVMADRHVLIYPNVLLMSSSIRQVIPVGVNSTIVHQSYAEVPAASPEVNEANQRNLIFRVTSSGVFGSDDLEMFASNQTGLNAARVEYIRLSRGLHLEERNADGELIAGPSDEVPQRSFWKQWRHMMSGEPGLVPSI